MKERSAIIVDAGPLIALVNINDHNHGRCKKVWQSFQSSSKLLMPVSALAEALAVLPEGRHVLSVVQEILSKFQIQLDCIQQHELVRAFDLMIKYADLPMDFADSEIVVISERLNIRTIFTMDSDFSIYRPKHIRRYDILQ